MAIMLEPLDQAQYQGSEHLVSDQRRFNKSAKRSSHPISSSSPKTTKSRIPRLAQPITAQPITVQGSLTPQFSIKRISELKEDKSDDRERKKDRKYSDDFEPSSNQTRRRVVSPDPSKMKSVSLEKLSNDSGVWYCVRGSQEKPGVKQASSISQPVDRASNQTAKLHRNAAYPRAYRHQAGPVVHPQKQSNKGYAAMYSAKQAMKEKQLIRAERKVKKIYKQTDDNRHRRESNALLDHHSNPGHPQNCYQQNAYPHTLPSAMYPPPHPSEYPALYGPLPPVIDQPLQPLPPINAHLDATQNMNTAEPEPSSSPCQSSSPSVEEKTNSYAKPQRLKITYKPYVLKDYNTMKAGFGARAGGLGPDTDSEGYKQKLALTNRKLEYAQKIREQHNQKDFPKKKPPAQYIPPSKTILGQEYARTIARPRVTKHKQLVPLDHQPRPDSRSSQDMIAEKLLLNMHHRKIMSDLGQLI